MVNASTQVRISFTSNCRHLEEKTKSFPSRKVCGSCYSPRRLTDNGSVGAVETSSEADEEGGEPSEMKPADKLLMVERGGFGMLQKHANQRRGSKDDQTHKDVKGRTTGDDQKTCSLSKTATVTTNKEKKRR